MLGVADENQIRLHDIDSNPSRLVLGE